MFLYVIVLVLYAANKREYSWNSEAIVSTKKRKTKN